jgi:hypothetical protein
LAAASGLMMTGADAAGGCEIRPDATSTSSSPGALQPSALHDNPTTTHDTGHPYFITTLPAIRDPIGEAEDSRRRATLTRRIACAATARSYGSVRCEARRRFRSAQSVGIIR